MKVQELIISLEELRERLVEHRKLWSTSLAKPIPDFPVRNIDELETQAQWLSRRVGALRPFIHRFDDAWIMTHPVSGTSWNALDAAVGLTAVAPIKGPSLRASIEKLDHVIGRLQSLNPDDFIPDDPNKPLRIGITTDQIISAYLDHLHPFISKGCAQLYRDGHYAQAVGEASRAVFQYLRDVTGLAEDGASLAQSAFSIKNPILAFSDLSDQTKKDEQVGFMEMLAAFAKGVRNPLAHTHGKIEEAQKSFEYLVMASIFCRRIDDATPKTMTS